MTFSYTPENAAAAIRLWDTNEETKRAIIRVNASTKRPVAHWRAADAHPDFPWLSRPALQRGALERHLTEPDAIIGVVPAFFGLVVLDVDVKSDWALECLSNQYGDALEIYPTPSGGHHCIYPVETDQDAMMFGGGAFLVEGQHYGEICSAKRYANCWSPVVFERAVKKRATATEFLKPTGVETPAPRETPLRGSSGRARCKFELQEVIEVMGLSQDARGGWRRHCPFCDPEKRGGGTRFMVSENPSGGLFFMCWSCARHGFGDKQYARLMRAIERRVKPRKSIIANLMG